MMEEKRSGVPQLLHLQDNLVLRPNLNAKPVEEVDELRQFPFASVKEKLVLPPILSKEEILYPLYPEFKEA